MNKLSIPCVVCKKAVVWRSVGDLNYAKKINRYSGKCKGCHSLKLLTLNENVPEYFDISSQRKEIRSGRNQLVVDKVCISCESRQAVLVRSIREALKKGNRLSGKCTECLNPGRIVSSTGYILVRVPEHPQSTKAGYVLEHRLVVESIVGRYLELHETVHHLDGDKINNAKENLQIRQGQHGQGVVRICGDCGSNNIIHSPLSDKAEVVDLVSA